MKVRALVEEVENDLLSSKAERIKRVLKEQIQEIEATEKVLAAMRERHENLLETPIKDVIFDHEIEDRFPSVNYSWRGRVLASGVTENDC